MPNYKHFLNMSDDIGMLQFSQCHHPDRNSGYTLDDNARALLVTLSMGEEGYPWALIFARYLQCSWQEDGTWSNLLQHGKYYHQFDSEDSFGRAFCACSAGSCSTWPSIVQICTEMLERAISKLATFNSPRGIAYALLGLCNGHFPFLPDNYHNNLVQLLAERLLAFYSRQHSPGWNWFENKLTYCNGILPHSLLAAYTFNGNRKYLQIARESLRFLNQHLFARGYLNIVGNEGWYMQDGKFPLWDQQPVDAASIIFACHAAYEATGQNEYQELVRLAYAWYRGLNINELPLYDVESGGCFDGLTREGVNLNQGAEAVLSLLLSDLLMAEYYADDLPRVQSL